MQTFQQLITAAAIAAVLAVPTAFADGTTSTDTADQQVNTLDQNGATLPAVQISSTFTELAGSTDNADALVAGLRSGSDITLNSVDAAGNPVQVTVANPAGKMGYGEVFITLALAQDRLSAAGIDSPTTQQLAEALSGTNDTSTQPLFSEGILQMRAGGEGWGRIAQDLGVKLGTVVSALRSASDHASSTAATAETQRGNDHAAPEASEQHGKPDTTDVANNANRPEHIDRPDKPERVERPEIPDRPERPERPQKPEIPDHPGRG